MKEENGALQKLNNLPPMQEDDLIEDFPERYTLSVTEHVRFGIPESEERSCTEDGSAVPVKDELVSSFQINGVKLHKRVQDDEQVLI